jgi:Fur family peroxide stress response transcriptional regulator
LRVSLDERVDNVFSATEALKAHGMRVTPQRIAIYSTLMASDEHPTVEAIYEQVLAKCPSISLNTVYTTLCTMADVGLIRHVDAGDGLCRYDGNPRPHVHVVCSNCRKVDDLDVEAKLDRRDIARRSGYDIDDVAVYFYGLCPNCKKRRASPNQ